MKIFVDDGGYNFNVSSYGLDRQFKTEYDFNKHIGKDVDIKFYSPFQGNKLIVAKLLDFTDNEITIEFNQNQTQIERKLIASITAHIEF